MLKCPQLLFVRSGMLQNRFCEVKISLFTYHFFFYIKQYVVILQNRGNDVTGSNPVYDITMLVVLANVCIYVRNL